MSKRTKLNIRKNFEDELLELLTRDSKKTKGKIMREFEPGRKTSSSKKQKATSATLISYIDPFEKVFKNNPKKFKENKIEEELDYNTLQKKLHKQRNLRLFKWVLFIFVLLLIFLIRLPL